MRLIINHEASYIAAPIINHDVQKSKFPVQILLYNSQWLFDWSPFIAYQRSKHQITLAGKFPEKFKDYSFNLEELREETYGINTCLEIIESKKMPYRVWGPGASKKLDYKKKRKNLDSKRLYRSFLQYAIKWNSINFLCASDSPLHDYSDKIDEGIIELGKALSLKNDELKIIYDCTNTNPDLIKYRTNDLEVLAKKILGKLLEFDSTT